jgi:GTPase SAR1 family protein
MKTILNNPIFDTANFIKNDVLVASYETQRRLIINKYIISIIDNNLETNYGLLELFILNKIHLIPIVLLFNGVPTYYIDNKIIEIDNKDEKTNYLISKNICINMEFNQNSSYPFMVDVLYYK